MLPQDNQSVRQGRDGLDKSIATPPCDDDDRLQNGFRRAKFRLRAFLCLLCVVWLMEVTFARGAYEALIEPFRKETLFSILLFWVAANLAFLINPKTHTRPKPRTYRLGRKVGLVLCSLSTSLVIILIPSGKISYSDVIRSENGIGFWAIWGPLMIAGFMLFLLDDRKLTLRDWSYTAVFISVALLPGGRTIPVVLLVMVVLKALIYSQHLKPISARSVTTLAVIGALGIWSMAMISSVRDAGLGEGTWSTSSLAQYGYESPAPGGAAVLANFGIIGESAIIARAMIPDPIPFTGTQLLVSDLLSFLPGVDGTIDQHSIDTYTEFGAPIETSRPGGFHTTLYVLGGNLMVVLGGFLYVCLTLVGVSRARSGHPLAFGFSILFLSAFVLGVYGVGLPTGMLFLSVIIYSGALMALRAFSSLRKRVIN